MCRYLSACDLLVLLRPRISSCADYRGITGRSRSDMSETNVGSDNKAERTAVLTAKSARCAPQTKRLQTCGTWKGRLTPTLNVEHKNLFTFCSPNQRSYYKLMSFCIDLNQVGLKLVGSVITLTLTWTLFVTEVQRWLVLTNGVFNKRKNRNWKNATLTSFNIMSLKQKSHFIFIKSISTSQSFALFYLFIIYRFCNASLIFLNKTGN